MYVPLVRVSGSHTIFGEPAILRGKFRCDPLILDPELIKKNLVMEEVVLRDGTVVAHM